MSMWDALAKVYANGGLAVDIQDTIPEIVNLGGGTVFIPDGHYDWNGENVYHDGRVPLRLASSRLAGVSGHLANWADNVAAVVLHNNKPQAPAPNNMPTMIDMGTNTHGQFALSPCEVEGIEFKATPPRTYTEENGQEGQAISFLQIPDFRIHHNNFVDFCNVAVGAGANDGWANVNISTYGVVDHNRFTNPYKKTAPIDGSQWAWGYGAYAGGYTPATNGFTKDISLLRGKYGPVAGAGIVYFEDNHFSYNRHATDAMDGGYPVVRYNLFDEPACMYSAASANIHGPAYPSAYGAEYYKNKFIGAPRNGKPWNRSDSYYSIATGLRGGKSLVYDNDFVCSTPSSSNYFIQLGAGDYVAGREEQQIKETYIWNNTHTGTWFSKVDSPIVLNRDYFLQAFPYTPYPYPHPRASNGVLPITHNLTVNSNINGVPFNIRKVS